MATVKTACPQCSGQGLIGTANASICPQCTGTGMISIDDSQSFATINTSNTGAGKTPLVVTVPPTIPAVAVRAVSKDRKN